MIFNKYSLIYWLKKIAAWKILEKSLNSKDSICHWKYYWRPSSAGKRISTLGYQNITPNPISPREMIGGDMVFFLISTFCFTHDSHGASCLHYKVRAFCD
jgi:hypothetical protein